MQYYEFVTQIVVALITLIGVFATGVIGYYTNRHARGINDAVNNRHQKVDKDGIMPPKIYDLAIDNDLRTTRVEAKVDELRDWKRGYDNSAFPNALEIQKFVKRVEGLEGGCKFECLKKEPE